MSGYSNAWLDASEMNVAAAAAAAAANSRSHQLYAVAADDECLRPAAPFTSCRPQPHHNVHYDVKQLQQPVFTGVARVLAPDVSAYSDDRYPVYGSYSVYTSCRRDCSSPSSRATAVAMHGRLGDSVFDGASDLQHDCSDGEQVDDVGDVVNQQLSNNDTG